MNFDLVQLQALFWQEMPGMARFFSVTALVLFSLISLGLVAKVPVRIRFGSIRLEGPIKICLCLFISAWAFISCWAAVSLPLLMVAKLGLIEFLIVGGVMCLFFALTSGIWYSQLTVIEAECELATNLTFLQGEMVRSQLEALNDRIRQSIEPEEVDVKESILKVLTPALMMVLRKETSIIKWSVAAYNIWRKVGHHLWSPKQ